VKKKDASFWSDIKSLDERLKREPDSFCFARLSEIYLKVGLVADALHTARVGVAKHPGYLAGKRALAMACNASDLPDESRALLEQVTAAMPEDVDAQKLLARLYVDSGDHATAIRTYRAVLDFTPDDKISLLELESLQNLHSDDLDMEQVSGPAVEETATFSEDSFEDDIIELSESDIFEELSDEVTMENPEDNREETTGHHDPLSTLTLAELYEKQGFLSKALAIYHTLLADDPTNTGLLAKIAQLEAPELDSEIPVFDDDVEELEEEDDLSELDVAEPAVTELESELESEPVQLESGLLESIQESVVAVEPKLSITEAYEVVPAPTDSNTFAPLANQSADNVVETLDGWLENIRRIKACR
jgi:tetratricopeptide (TPR) repeat protein